jgi:NAD(P)-dependent dehydrogenase (short-subunit alcohol dehydrogenase family)
MKVLDGKVAIVTGSSRGIGREIARLLLARGAHVVLNGRSPETLEETARELRAAGGKLTTRRGDVSQVEEARGLVEETIAAHGALDILVNNAGLSQRGYFWEQDPAVMKAMIDVNFLGVAYPTRFALPQLMEAGGSVVFVSSLAALRGLPGNGSYSASKMAQTALVECLRTELALVRRNVHVGIVYVGVTKNDPEKTVLGPDGSPQGLAKRNAGHDQAVVARAVVRAIERRRFRTYVGVGGPFVGWVTRHAPWLTEAAIRASRKRVKRMLE